jgi:2-amino-4-hydroxy-6-hydroxymethyldihydropteridine diphosphokinase
VTLPLSGADDESTDLSPVRRVFLGMGSNLGDRRRQLADAVASLHGVTAVSPVYETAPVGGPAQGAFLNIVVELATALSPRHLLGVCHRLEAAAGRMRGERWGPRTLDVDLLWMSGVTVDEPDLVVPHPRMWERRFVLAPLADLAPELVPARVLALSEGRVRSLGPL